MKCKQCGNERAILNDDEVCHECFKKSLIDQECRACGYQWKSPEFGKCTSCGSYNVTSGDANVDREYWQQEARKHKIKFLGMQQAYKDKVAIPLFDVFGATFTLEGKESIADAMKRKQEQFAATAQTPTGAR